MTDGLFDTHNYVAVKKMLDAVSLRHGALASNLANAETPGYKRVDLSKDFETTLRSSITEGHKQNIKELSPGLEYDKTAVSLPGGNNVEIDHELMEINRNAMAYQFLTQKVGSSIKQMKMAITGHSA